MPDSLTTLSFDDLLGSLDFERRARREAEARSSANESHLRAVLDSSQEAILTFNEQGTVMDANAAAELLFNFSRSDMVGLQVVNLITALYDNFSGCLEKIKASSAKNQVMKLGGFIHTAGAEAVPVSLNLRWIASSLGTSDRYVALITDCRYTINLENQLRELQQSTRRDKLHSGIFHTRNYLKDRFDEIKQMACVSVPNAEIAIAYVDIDRFKRINDHVGFDAGDQAIREIGLRLDVFLRTEAAKHGWDVGMCRMSGDEFVMLLISERKFTGLDEWSKRLQNCMTSPLESYEQRFVVSLSAGIACSPLVHAMFDTLITDADMAMRSVKSRGGNGCLIYSGSESNTDQRPRATEHNVLVGMERKQFQPFFQPKVCAQTGQILGFETLLRWQHPERGLIPLNEFLPILERSSLMLDVGLQIFEQMVNIMAQWQAKGCFLPMSFNISNGELLSERYRTSLIRLVKTAGIVPHWIYLEITENVLTNLGTTGEEAFIQLQREGFRLSVDDFGVGSSSLSRLSTMPLCEIKIDRSFISGITHSARDLDLLKGIVNLAKSLNLEVVIEGVESSQQLEIARSLGNLSIQGFCYSPAVPAEQAYELIQTQPFVIH